jgi:hypothetical protein
VTVFSNDEIVRREIGDDLAILRHDGINLDQISGNAYDAVLVVVGVGLWASRLIRARLIRTGAVRGRGIRRSF